MNQNYFRLGICAIIFAVQASYSLGHGKLNNGAEINSHIVSVKSKDFKTDLKEFIAKGYDIAGVDVSAGIIDLVVNDSVVNMLRVEKGQSIEAIKTFDPLMAPDAGYTTYDELTLLLNKAQQAFPDLMQVESIGKSHEGREIWAVKISDSVEQSESDEPVVFFNAMHHAREVMTTEVAVDIIGRLTSEYGRNSKIKNWVDRNEIWIVPMVNPDGNNKVWTSNSMWRKNTREGHGVDVNRNYPYKWGACNGSSGNKSDDTYRGPSAGSEPETQALMGLIAKIKPVLSISYHSYSELVLYPYSCEGEHTPIHETIANVGQTLAGRLPKDGASGYYTPGTSWEILYGVDGGDSDWAYAEHDVLPFVIEVSSKSQGFQPSFTQWRQRTVEKMRAGWGYMLDRAGQSGIRGRVFDKQGRQLYNGSVSLELLSGQKDTSKSLRTFKIKPNGVYHLVTEPGMYRLTVVSQGESISKDVLVGGTLTNLDLEF